MDGAYKELDKPRGGLNSLKAGLVSLWRFIWLGERKRPDERQEMHELYTRAYELYVLSPLADIDPDDFSADCVLDACRLAERSPARPIIRECLNIVDRLMLEEGFWNCPDFAWCDEYSLNHQMVLREGYRRKIRFYADYDHRLIVWRTVVISMIATVLLSIPNDILPTCLEEDEEEDDAPTFSVPLVTTLDNPGFIIETILTDVVNAEISGLELLERFQEQLLYNLYQASGIRMDEKRKAPPRFTLPTAAKGLSDMELVETYFGGTALELLLAHPLPFSIPDEVRFEHCHILGGTGHGKTQLLQLLIYQDLLKAQNDGRSVIVIDSQGDMIQTLSRLALFSPEAEKSLADRLVIVDPTDIEFPVALNMFDCKQDRIDGYGLVEKEKLLNGIIALYSYLFGALLGAELTDKQGVIFKYLARLMLVIPDATIHTMRQLMEDATPFKPYIAKLDPTTRQFFETQFFSRSFAQTKQQIARRLWSVLSHSTLDRMFSQTRSSLDLFEAMNSGKIILINTAKDLLKEDGSQVLGRFFISMIVQAAMERATIPKDERTPCYVYVDEAQEYFDESVSDLLIQARKYKVSLTSAHQTLDQLSPALRSTMMTNTSTKLIGGVSAKDARTFADEIRCQADYLQDIKKRKDETEFACWIRNHTGKPITLFVPLGAVERQPTLSDDEYLALIDENRGRYCVRWDGSQAVDTEPIDTPEPSHERKTQNIETERSTVENTDAAKPRPKKSVSVEPSPMGQGGQKHVYMQTLIKRCAEERGWRAIVEKPVADGAGRVDVSLEHGKRKIACEISVTTTVDHELGNVRKCFDAEYDHVLVVAADAKRLDALEQYMSAHLNTEEQAIISFITPENVIDFLDTPRSVEQSEHQTVRGYRVKVSRANAGPDRASSQREAIAGIIAKSLRK